MLRMVPERERMTREWVVAWPCRYRTPSTSSPSVIPVAAKNTSSEVTRSSVVSTRFRSWPASSARRRPPDAEHQVDPGALPRGHDRAGHVAVSDQVDPGTAGADLGDQVGVPGPV